MDFTIHGWMYIYFKHYKTQYDNISDDIIHFRGL